MMNEFEFTLHSPLTEEDWNKILDVEHENTISVTFQTPQGKQVRYIKCEVLDKIRTEIKAIVVSGQIDENTLFIKSGEQVKQMALEIIDKYKTESEEVCF